MINNISVSRFGFLSSSAVGSTSEPRLIGCIKQPKDFDKLRSSISLKASEIAGFSPSSLSNCRLLVSHDEIKVEVPTKSSSFVLSIRQDSNSSDLKIYYDSHNTKKSTYRSFFVNSRSDMALKDQFLQVIVTSGWAPCPLAGIRNKTRIINLFAPGLAMEPVFMNNLEREKKGLDKSVSLVQPTPKTLEDFVRLGRSDIFQEPVAIRLNERKSSRKSCNAEDFSIYERKDLEDLLRGQNSPRHPVSGNRIKTYYKC